MIYVGLERNIKQENSLLTKQNQDTLNTFVE